MELIQIEVGCAFIGIFGIALWSIVIGDWVINKIKGIFKNAGVIRGNWR